MLSLLKKNSLILGMALAIIAPVSLYFLLSLLIVTLSDIYTNGVSLIRDHNIMLISIFMNLLIFKTYIHKPPYDKTGKGVMIITFIMTAIYFIWRYKDYIL